MGVISLTVLPWMGGDWARGTLLLEGTVSVCPVEDRTIKSSQLSQRRGRDTKPALSIYLKFRRWHGTLRSQPPRGLAQSGVIKQRRYSL